MKFFRWIKNRREKRRPQTAVPDSEQSLYSRYAGEDPLDHYADSAFLRQTRRTSRHSPARRRESNNRASNWTLAALLLRALLIVVLLAGGFLALRLVLNRMAEPSKKDQQQWEDNAALMENRPVTADTPAGASVPQAPVVMSPEFMGKQLERWDLTERRFRAAEALDRRGIDEEAAERLTQALQTTPDNRAAQSLLLDIYMRSGRYTEAIPLCIRRLDQDSGQWEVQMNLLRALSATGQTGAGLVLADRMLEMQPNNLTVLETAAKDRLAQGSPETAFKLFERILANDGKNAAALAGCAQIYFNQGDYSNAVPYYLELVKVTSKPEYYRSLAQCYSRLNESGKAVIFMGQASSLFGETAISTWLSDPELDPVRETADFRAFADSIVGIETRKAIESINRREAEKATTTEPGGTDLPQQPALQAIRPGR
jgi:tetratricopeptide (TPR) repeat protein